MKRVCLLLLLVIALLPNVLMAQKGKKTHKKKVGVKKVVNKPEEVVNESQSQNSAIKVLLSESQSNVEEPFVLVVRDQETLAKLFEILPESRSAINNINFKTTAIVAVFAGTKPTPGYEIVFQQTANNLKVDLTAPPRDAVFAQVLTAPVKIVAVPLIENGNLNLQLGENWQGQASIYKISKSEFRMSGGILGISKTFGVTGTITVLRLGDLATVVFNLNGADNEKPRQMLETSSGKISNGALILSRVEAGSLIDPPHPPLIAKGAIDDKAISLTFESLPSNVADGFQGGGKLEAAR